MSNPKDYSVGWICAITTEYVAAQSFLDEEHEGPEYVSANDNNDYTLGKIGKHNVVIAVLPDGEYGISSATSVARDMVHSFPNIRIGLMVGIGGGAPSKNHDIRLGDIVISAPRDGKGGVFQYDFGKTVQEQSFQHIGFLNQPPMVLRTAISGLRSQYELKGHQLDLTISKLLENRKRLKRKYSRPPLSTDLLYRTDIIHPLGDETGCTIICGDSPSKLILRPERTEDEDIPAIHYGLIASANQLMKDALIRDTLATEKDVLCFEMEAAGLMNHFPCLVIRGICDYSDSHKNKAWQGYAAMAAAAYAKDLLYRIPPNKIEAEKRIGEVLSDVKERIIDMSQNITRIVRMQLDQELEAILDWITPIDYSSQHNDFVESRQPGTGEWLLNSREFQNWTNQSNQTLFCPGIPGAGKTIATSIVVSYLHEKFQNKTDIGIGYLYLNFRRQSEQEPIHILSSLLRQFSQTGSTIHDSVKSLHKHHTTKEEEEKEKEKDRPTSKTSPSRPSLGEIVQALSQTIASYSRAYIIIDALDECTDSNLHRSSLMAEIFNLQTRMGANLFFTSRFVPHIKKDFENRECSMLEIRATDEDMRQYLEKNMPQLPSFIFKSSGLEERIKSSIIEASKGMFLLTILHLDSLRDKISVWQVEDTLERLPKGSNAYQQAYDGAMGRIRSQKQGFCDLANRVLSWITCSRRPLSTLELQHALAVVDGTSAINPRNLTEIGLMVSVCAGLVTVDEHSGIIRLVHYTVQEYFERTWGTWFPNAQTDIAKTCITYLSFDIFQAGASSTDEVFGAGLQSTTLYDYAACNWGYHVRISSDPDVNLLTVGLLESEATASTWKQAMQVHRSSWYRDQKFQPTGGLHMAAYFGLVDPMKVLLKKHDPDSEVQDWTPIHWASLGGQEAVVRLLLENDANPNVGSSSDCPLRLAVEQGHTAVARTLLEGAANPDDNSLGRYLEHASGAGDVSMAELLLLWWRGHHRSHYYPLHLAAQSGHEAVVKLLLDKGIGLESQDSGGKTPIQHAASNGHEAVVKLLLEKGANLESGNVNSQTLLLEAAHNGHHAGLRLLLDNGADLEFKDKDGHTPLLIAIWKGHEGVVKLLLEMGANLKTETSYGQTPLTLATWHGESQIMKLLLENGANPNPRPGAYTTALYSAAKRGHVEMVRLLLNKGADPRYTVREGQSSSNPQPVTALHGAAEGGHEAVMRLLLNSGASVGDKDSWEGPLGIAAWKGYVAVVKLLLESGISPNVRSTPLLSAAMGGHTEIVKLLLECGANPNAKGADGTTPLAQSANSGYEAIVKLLLEHGADPDAGRVAIWTPLAAAAHHGHEAVVRLLLEGGAELKPGKNDGNHGEDPLYWASRSRHDAVIKLLLDKGAELESKHKTGWFARTPLHCASYIGYEPMVRLFLENGADYDAKDEDGRTPLHIATERGSEEIVRLLLAEGANPEITTGTKGSLMSLAAEKGHAAIVKLLLDKGANPDIGIIIGTPLSLAARGGHEAIVKLLLDRGADPDNNSSIGSPLSVSIENGHEAVVKLLLDKGANPNALHWGQKPALCIAAECGQAHVAKLLLEKGAHLTDTACRDYVYVRQQPIHLAASRGHEAVVTLLLDNGLGPDILCDYNRQTPLHKAASNGHEAVVRLLLNKGADPDPKDGRNQTPLYYATEGKYEAVVKILLQSGASPNITGSDHKTPLLRYLNPNGRDMIKLFLESGMSTELEADKSCTLLHCSIQLDCTSMTRLLLTYNASTEARDQYGETPLHMAAQRGLKVAAKLLLDKGANVNSKCNKDNSPLHNAARNENEIVVKLLLDRGADIQAKTVYGETPLHYAVSSRKVGIVKILLMRGANVHFKDCNGKTALQNAESNGLQEIAGLLLDRLNN